MNFRLNISVSILLILLASTAHSQRPNIVIVLADDQGYGDLGRAGNPDIKTPHIDAFAEHAVVFNQFLCSPVCSPTRSSLLTGRYNYRTQVVDTFKGRSVMNPDEVTLAEILKENGYSTGIFGKWHLGDNYPMRPQDQGFDEVLVHLGGGIGQPSDPEGGSRYVDPVLQHNGVETQFSGYCMDVYTDHALRFMEQNQDEPFFVYLATNTPHAPWDDVPQKYRDMYEGIPAPSRVYYGMISNIDDNFKRVLDRLEVLGKRDNTIVIYMSDNGQASAGASRYTAGLNGAKGTVYENGIRVPFFVQWPERFTTPKTIETMAAHIDILPTLLSATGIELPAAIHTDGRNLLSLIEQDNPAWTDRHIAFQFHRGNAPNLFQNSAIRSQNWKLINNRERGEMGTVPPSFELYDLEHDPGEKTNLATQKPKKVNQMRAAYEAWFEDVTSGGFDLPRATLGTVHQTSTTFTKQDLWIPQGGPESHGYFRAYAPAAGQYNVTLQFRAASPAPKVVRLTSQGVDLTGTLASGDKDFVFENVTLKKGNHDLRTWQVDRGDKLTQRTLVEAVSKKKPNVIILFSDQHNKQVMGFEGHPDVITPHLDQLAGEGLVFDRAYCATGICVPSRLSLMTGLYPRTLGVLSNGGATSVVNHAVSMATIFQHNQYSTYAFGKRHLKGAIDEGWDVHKSHMHGESPDESYITWLEKKGHARAFAEDWAAEFGRGPNGSSQRDTRFPTADLGTRLSKLPEDATMEAYTTRETIEVIKQHAKSDRPFFCWANFYRPHQPYTPLKKYMDLYNVTAWGRGTKQGSGIKKPASFYEPTGNLPPLLQSQRNGGNKVWNMDKAFKDEQLWRNFIGAYYALVTEIDHCVGQILAALEDAGIEEETLVIYTSDHGDFVGNHGMVEMAAVGHNVYEDILNVPLIIKYPGRTEQGKRTAELVSLVDVLPTLIDLLGLEVPELTYPIQGLSMADLILNNTPTDRDYVVSESWSQAAVITEDHKLGIMLDPTAVHRDWDYREFGDMFFDRATDPIEIQNGISDTKYQPVIQTLRSYYEAFKQDIPATGKLERVRQASKRR